MQPLDIDVNIPEVFQPLFTPAPYKAFYGGRGAAKSRSFASALVIMAIQRPLQILCAREIQRSINASVKRLVDNEIKRLGVEHLFTSTLTEIRAEHNASSFTFAGLWQNSDSIKSLEGIDICWVEEANRVSQPSLDILIPTIREDNSEIWFSWNRKFVADPVDSMFLGSEGPPPGSIIREVNYGDNPFFPDVLRAKMEYDKGRDTDKYLHVWCGQPANNTESRVFRNWKVEDFEAPDDAVFRLGADWGFSVDPTVLIRLYIDEDERRIYIDHEAYAVGCEIDDLPKLFDDAVPLCRKHTITGDSQRPDTISYIKRKGFRIVSAIKGKGSIEDGVEFLKSYDIVIHQRCIQTIDEFTLFSYKVDKLTNKVLTTIEDKNNHCIDSIRYAVEDVMKAKTQLRVRFL